MNQFELPAEIIAQLEAAPNNSMIERHRLYAIVDAAVLRYYDTKSITAIAKACGVSLGLVQSRIDKLIAQGQL